MKHSQSINDKIKAQISALRQLIFAGEKSKIESWFTTSDFENDSSLKSALLKEVMFSHGFFAYRCTSFNKNFLEEESLWRHKAILKNYPFKEQVEMLLQIAQMDSICKKHIDILNFSKEAIESQGLLKEESIKNTLGLIACRMFNYEQFDVINALEEKMGFPLMPLIVSPAPIYHEEPNIKSCFYVSAKPGFFMPQDNIIFSYSKNKYDFLLSKDLSPPSSHRAEAIVNKLKENIKTDSYTNNASNLNLINVKLQEYLILSDKENLNKNVAHSVKDLTSNQNKI